MTRFSLWRTDRWASRAS